LTTTSPWAHADGIAEMLCEGFEIPPSTSIERHHGMTRHVVVDGKHLVVYRNGWVALPDGFPAGVYAGLDLDIRAYWVDHNLNPTGPPA
jgi:hypothetical protein